MGSTTLHALPFPEGSTAPPTVHLGIKALAESLDAKLTIVCTSSTRPPHVAGRHIFETDTKRDLVSDGTNWHRISSTQGGSPAPLAGTYAGEPLIPAGGHASVTTDAASLGTFNFASVAPFSRGLMSFVPVSTNDPNYQWRVVRPANPAAANPNQVQLVTRTHDTGNGTGAITANFQWIALGW